tara:strand:+ start:309 stop:794 length:486 start_codon:yes stop_codon:yes gene_type:complete
MQFGEVLTQLREDCPKTTGYDENIILLKEIENVLTDGCKTDLILDVVEVDKQWILDSEDEVNILMCVDVITDTDNRFDLCKFFNDPKITIGLMVAAPEHSDIFFNHFSETYSLAEWEVYAPEQLKDFQAKYFMFVVLGSKTGFFCLNWTYNQMAQLMKMVV